MSLGTPRDFHNDYAEDHSVSRRNQVGLHAAPHEADMAAYERGRQQGELDTIRRLEAEGRLGNKTFVHDTTVVNGAAPVATANLVEIEHLTWLQKGAAVVGEVCSLGYLIIMAYWIDQYRGGVGWDNGRNNNNAGMFNVHVIASFVGLFAVSQAYLTYRALPLRIRPLINKLIYIGWQVLAMACWAITIAAAVLSQPGVRMQSMHAWTAMLAVLVYFVHAVYSILKLLLTNEHGMEAHRWNETVNIAEQPTSATWHLTPEQRRDHNSQLPTLYRPAPSMWGRFRNRTAYNADGTAAAPVWAESDALTANNFFLLPRAKWAVASLVGLGAACLIGLGEWQVLLAAGQDQWSQDGRANREGILDYTDTEARLIGVIGLAALTALLTLAYAAMPPRTVVAKGQFGSLPLSSVAGVRTSISTGVTQPHTVVREEEVV